MGSEARARAGKPGKAYEKNHGKQRRNQRSLHVPGGPVQTHPDGSEYTFDGRQLRRTKGPRGRDADSGADEESSSA